MKVNYLSLILFGIVFFQLNGFYLLDGSQIPVQFQDAAIFLEVLFFFIVYNRRTRSDLESQKKSKTEKWLFLIPILLGITSAMMGYVRYHQPFIMGLRPQRAWIISMLMYFPLKKVLSSGRYSTNRLIKMIDEINAIYFVLLLVQCFLGKQYMFLHITVDQRYGSVRLYAATSFMLISYAWHLWKLLNNKQIKFIDIFFVISTLLLFFYITKSRMGMVALIGATAIVILRQKFTKKKLMTLSLGIVALCVFFSTDAGLEILKLAFGAESSSIGNDTSLIREVGRTFFISEVISSVKTLIFGCGYINIDWEPTVRAVRYNENIFVADNGIFGITFMYGIVFLIWMGILYSRYIGKSIKNKNDFGICIFLAGILGCFSLYPECYKNCIAFPLACVIFENMYSEEDEEIYT